MEALAEARRIVALLPHRQAGVRYAPGQAYDAPADVVDELVAGGQAFVPGAVAVDWWTRPGRVLAAEPLARGPQGEEPVFARSPALGSLRILQGTGYDPGCAAYRFHSALNECTQHASAFVRWSDTSPYSSLRQYDGDRDLAVARQLAYEADVVHCHMGYMPISRERIGFRPAGLLVRHYHGSRQDDQPWLEQRQDDLEGAVQVGARLQHLMHGDRIQWLPIPMPVSRYARMQVLASYQWRGHKGFRVAHSPTDRNLKGTDTFLAVCERLQRMGVPIEPVLIEKLGHGEALELKATCDAVFDSFWLGIQGSGLEGGAMGLPVVAGDPDVAALYRQHLGEVPYTYANDAASLEAALERLAMDPRYRMDEALRVSTYVQRVHDYPAVARRYEQILAEALGRPEVMTPARERQAA